MQITIFHYQGNPFNYKWETHHSQAHLHWASKSSGEASLCPRLRCNSISALRDSSQPMKALSMNPPQPGGRRTHRCHSVVSIFTSFSSVPRTCSYRRYWQAKDRLRGSPSFPYSMGGSKQKRTPAERERIGM